MQLDWTIAGCFPERNNLKISWHDGTTHATLTPSVRLVDGVQHTHGKVGFEFLDLGRRLFDSTYRLVSGFIYI